MFKAERSTSRRAYPRPLIAGVLLLAVMAGCDDREAPPPKVATIVDTRVAEFAPQRTEIELTGTIEAENSSDLGFRLAGRIASREVDVGDKVRAGQILARLDSDTQRADVAAAEAGVATAEATLRQARTNYDRQQGLLQRGFATRETFEDAGESLRAAEAGLDAAEADLGVARDALANTDLRASADGVVTERTAETGQVVEAAQPVFSVALDGGRDAVFDVHEAALTHRPAEPAIGLVLISDPSVRVDGSLREISPVIDPATGTIRVKVALPPDAPEAMTLGASVTGVAVFLGAPAAALPWTALSRAAGAPAVFVVDPASKAVAAKPVTIAGYRTGLVLVADGLEAGDQVVTAGSQFLWPGQVVDPRATSSGEALP